LIWAVAIVAYLPGENRGSNVTLPDDAQWDSGDCAQSTESLMVSSCDFNDRTSVKNVFDGRVERVV